MNLNRRIVLLPWGCGTPDLPELPRDILRCYIERFGGEVAYRDDDVRPYSHRGATPDQADMVFLPTGDTYEGPLEVLTQNDLNQAMNDAFAHCRELLHARSTQAYVPVVDDSVFHEKGSRYFGSPWLPEGLEWPELEERPLPFLLQLRLSELPGLSIPHKPDDLLLLFHGDSIGDIGEDYVILKVDSSQPGCLARTPENTIVNSPLSIVSWKMMRDFPHQENIPDFPELDSLSSVLYGIGSNTMGKVRSLDVDEDIPIYEAISAGLETDCDCLEVDKAGGWAHWAQGDETPSDRNGVPMVHVYQIGYQGISLMPGSRIVDHGSLNWPNWGHGHIFMSQDGTETTFNWAC